MSTKAVRTTVVSVRDHNDDGDVAINRVFGDDGYEPGDDVVVLPAADFDAMVERARDVADRLQTLAEISIDFCDHDGNHPDNCRDCPDYREHHKAARAFLAETKGESDGT
jgi:hypothetical protein